MRSAGRIPRACAVLLLIGGSSGGGTSVAFAEAIADLKLLTQARTRVVWVQDQSESQRDSLAQGKQLELLGLDSEDGLGERAILRARRNYAKPLLTPDGQAVIYSDRTTQKVYVVNFDGTGKRQVCNGFALDVWTDPQTETTWVYVGRWAGDVDDFRCRSIRRVNLNDAKVSETVWDKTEVSPDNFQLSADGTRVAGEFPWPNAGVANLVEKTWTKRATGCWSSLAPDNSYLGWVFDGPHRNLQISTADNSANWSVNINTAPGINGHEVFHPRWSNHVRFLVLTGPYEVDGKVNKISGGGPAVEIHVGRFQADFARIEGWTQVTHNRRGDFHPDLWIEGGNSSQIPVAVATPTLSDPQATTVTSTQPNTTKPRQKWTVVAKRLELTPIPDPKSILPYRRALVTHHYRIERVLDGKLDDKEILVAHWAIREGAVLPGARVKQGVSVQMMLERFEDHSELKSERQIIDLEELTLPLYLDVTPPAPQK